MGAQEVSTVLWRERELLELLLFKLEEEQLLLTAGKSKWLQHATREVEQVMERLRRSGLERSVEVAALAKEWGVRDDASLRELAEAPAAGPWREVFEAHLTAMTRLTEEIAALRDANTSFLRAAMRSTQETLASVDAGPSGYDRLGPTQQQGNRAALFVDRSL